MNFGNIMIFGDSYSTFPGVVPNGMIQIKDQILERLAEKA